VDEWILGYYRLSQMYPLCWEIWCGGAHSPIIDYHLLSPMMIDDDGQQSHQEPRFSRNISLYQDTLSRFYTLTLFLHHFAISFPTLSLSLSKIFWPAALLTTIDNCWRRPHITYRVVYVSPPSPLHSRFLTFPLQQRHNHRAFSLHRSFCSSTATEIHGLYISCGLAITNIIHISLLIDWNPWQRYQPSFLLIVTNKFWYILCIIYYPGICYSMSPLFTATGGQHNSQHLV
jgi:hypothetical protein